MSKISLSQLSQIKQNKDEYIELDYDIFKLKLKTRLTNSEEELFVNIVCEKSFDGAEYSPILRRTVTEVLFAKFFIVSDEDNGLNILDTIDDLYEVFDSIKKLDLLNRLNQRIENKDFTNYYNYLELMIEEKINYEMKKMCSILSQSSANTEAIENVNELLNKFMKLLETVNEFVSVNGKKFNKVLTPKKIEDLIKTIQDKGIKILSDKLETNEVSNKTTVKSKNEDVQLDGQTTIKSYK